MAWELQLISGECNFPQKITAKKPTKANGPQRFTSSIDSILGEVSVEERFKVSLIFVQIMMCKATWSHPPLHLPLGSIFLSASNMEILDTTRGMKRVLTSILIQKRFQVICDTGIKVIFLCLRFQVIFVNGSLIESANRREELSLPFCCLLCQAHQQCSVNNAVWIQQTKEWA